MTKNEELMTAILGDPEDDDENQYDDQYLEESNQNDQTKQNEKFLDNLRMMEDDNEDQEGSSQHLKTVKEIATEDQTQ